LRIEPLNPLAVKLIQITDSHLEEQVGGLLLGLNTDDSLQAVISLIAEEHPDVDLLLATGDISNCGSEVSYQRFRSLTAGLAAHALWLPGNHDLNESMRTVIGAGEELGGEADVSSWKILMLDSSVDGEVGGRFSEDQLQSLRTNLEESKDRHVLICLHHHPIKIGCEWLDTQKVSNADQFLEVLDNFEHVRGVLWGHIHQEVDQQRNGVRFMATPSSCVQFAPNSPEFKLDLLPPGYRCLELFPDGTIETGVSRASDFPVNIDMEESQGY
jgi:Icc protein